jgi:arabinofuranan 3-O-arabinosyltransferase
LSGEQSANLVDALEARIADGTLGPGELGTVARALGVDRVLIRNDLDWEQSQVVRPADLDLVRADPDLELDQSFGEPGQSVTDPDDTSFATSGERSLPPVEVYSVRGAADAEAPPGLARAAVTPALVSGDGGAWPAGVAAGVLDDDRPVAYTGDLDAAALTEALDAGSPLVVTDTNRRRLTRIRGAVPTRSHTLSEGQDLDQPAQDLFARPHTQSVAEFEDATSIEASSSGTRIIGFQPWLRPANAFDDNFTTSWLTGGLEDPVGAYVRVNFRAKERISRLSLLPFLPTDAGRRVTDVSLHFSSGDPFDVHLDEVGTTEVRLPVHETDFLEIRIEDVSRAGTAAVGFREIAIPGVDLTEVIATPDDVVVAADTDPDLRAALADAPLRYLFERVRGTGAQDEEIVIRRGFRLAEPRSFTVDGRLDLDERTTDLELDRFLSGFRDDEVSAFGSTRAQGAIGNRGVLAVDGDPSTSWATPARDGETLTVRFPTQTVSRIRVASPADAESSPVNRVDVVVGGREESLDLVPDPDCEDDDCPQVGTLEIPATPVEEVVVRLASTVSSGPTSTRPARLSEVEISDGDGPPVQIDDSVDPEACSDALLTVDGRPVGIRLADGDLDRALAAERVAFTSCSPVPLATGRHVLATPDAIIDDVTLSSGGVDEAPAGAEPRVEVLDRDAGHLRLRVSSDGDALVSTGQSYDPGWRATVDGKDLGPARPVGTLATWSLGAGTHEVDLTYAPERPYRAAFATTLIGLAICAAILLRPALRARAPRPPTPARRPT